MRDGIRAIPAGDTLSAAGVGCGPRIARLWRWSSGHNPELAAANGCRGERIRVSNGLAVLAPPLQPTEQHRRRSLCQCLRPDQRRGPRRRSTTCFDKIDHTVLMDRLRRRIGDKRVLALVKSFLKAGVLTTAGTREGTITGTPQGGILSPLLANIALSVLDDHFVRQWQTMMATEQQRQKRRRRGLANYRLVRYADDFVVLVTGEREQAQALRGDVEAVLAPMGLRLSEAKTRVAHIDDGFDFLGFSIRRMQKRGSHKHFVYTRPSTKAIASIKDRVRAMTYRATLHHDPGYVMDYLGRVLRGWAHYFRHGVSKRTFNAIDSYTWERITHWLRQKHRIGWPERRRRFCLPGTWRLVHDGKRFRGAASVTVIRYRYRGYRIPTPWTPSTTPA